MDRFDLELVVELELESHSHPGGQKAVTSRVFELSR